MPNSKNRAALYLRLSKEDGFSESASIATQRTMLQHFAAEQGFSVADIYVDDGYSGTTFDRPSFSRMIDDIEAGKIDIVIVKDLSRLGRDYIATGQITELFFPARGVRCIAVNDGYDSAASDADIVPFRNILNEMYARDISKKIRSAFLTKMREGKFVSAFAPYGYRKDPLDHNRLLADPVAGEIIRSIFRMAAAGLPASEIAARLNADAVPAPLAYRALQQGNTLAECPNWTASTVAKMLHNEIYLGHTIQGKTKKLSFKSSRSLKVPPQEQIAVHGTHEALVSEALFRLVQKTVSARTRRKTNHFTNLFSKIAYCADCNAPMSSTGTRKKGSPAVLVCGRYKQHGMEACGNHFIDYSALYQIVLSVLREHLSKYSRDLFDAIPKRKTAARESAAFALAEMQQRLQTLDRIIADLYEDLASGKMTRAQHDRLIERYSKEVRILEQTAATLSEAEQSESSLPDPAQQLQTLLASNEISRTVLLTLIERIEIGQGNYLSEDGKRIKRQTVHILLRFQTEEMCKEYRL